MATNLLSSVFLAKAPQQLRKFWEVGVRHKSIAIKSKFKSDEDIFFEAAKRKKYRSRSAYKLIHFDEKYELIKPGYKVLDIGAAPGSWSEYLAARTNSNRSDINKPVGLVVAVDKIIFSDIPGVVTLPNTDFLVESSQNKVMQYLSQGKKFDFILSDLSSGTGKEDYDIDMSMKQVYCILMFSLMHLRPQGGVLLKVTDDGDKGFFKSDMKRIFDVVKFDGFKEKDLGVSDVYFIGKNFMGLDK